MNDIQRNRLTMYQTVRDYLAADSSVWGSVVAITNLHTALKNKISAIEKMVTAQEAELRGYTQKKANLRKDLEAKILLVANAAASYASGVGNELLLAEVALTPTNLVRTSEQQIDGVAERVYKAVASLLTELADYGVTAADHLAIKNAREAFEAGLTLPAVKRAARTGMTAALEPLFTETSQLLKEQLDLLMARYKTTAPEFHAGYEAARVIIDLRGPGKNKEPKPPPVP